MPELGKSELPITTAKAAIDLSTVASSIPRTQAKVNLDYPLYTGRGNEGISLFGNRVISSRRRSILFWMQTLLVNHVNDIRFEQDK
jgi:hypothetical protein